MSLFANWNGRTVSEEKICISPNNRSFRYGDGCFETMKVADGKLVLADLHFQRLFSSLQTLRFIAPDFFTAAYITTQIVELVNTNGHQKLARVRLIVYRGDGGLYDSNDTTPFFIIQSWPGNNSTLCFNEDGLTLDIYNDAKITADLFSSIKSNNYLAYSMGAMFAKENGADDCILTNAFNRIAESTVANVFIVSDGIIKTPPLTEGCVGGVMRRHLLQSFEKESIPFLETEMSVQELLSASEVFLTNANYGIRWVKKIGEELYANSTSALLHKKFIDPLFNPATF